MKKDARSTDMGDRPARAGAVANAAQILFLNRWYYPEVFGGTETSLRDLARTLLDMGVQVSVVCETRSLPTGWQNVEGVRVYRHGGPPPPRSHWSLRSLDMYGHNIAWLRRLRPELEGLPIVARTYWYAAAARAALPRARLIYWVPGTGRLFEPIEQSGLKGRAQAWAAFETAQARWIERRALRGANLILVESAHVRRDLVEHYRVNPHKVRQTWIGVDSARFQPRPPDHALLGELGLPPQAPVILCVARLAPMKNHPFLLRAFAQLTNRRAVLIFLGDGPDREALQSLAASLQIGDRVYFPGFRDDVERFFSVASVFVLASHYEPYGVVFSEALASGVPALALRPGLGAMVASAEHIVHGENGFLVEPKEEDLAAKIDLLLADPHLRGQMAARARAYALERYDWRRTARVFLEAARVPGASALKSSSWQWDSGFRDR